MLILETAYILHHSYMKSPLHSPQYPATIVLLVIIAVFGFVKPYNSMIGNILETAFAVDIMVLLFLRNTQQIKDKLQVLQLRNLSSNECEDRSRRRHYKPDNTSASLLLHTTSSNIDSCSDVVWYGCVVSTYCIHWCLSLGIKGN